MAWRVAFAAVRFDDDQLAWPHRRKGAAAGLAIAHPRRTCGQASGIAVRKADSRFASRFRPHRGDAPIVVIEIGRAPSELQSLMRTSYAVFCLQKKNTHQPPCHACNLTSK